MSNPSVPHTVSRSWLEREFELARRDPDPSAIAHFVSQHLNQFASESIGVDRWIPLQVWDACCDLSITYDSLRSCLKTP